MMEAQPKDNSVTIIVNDLIVKKEVDKVLNERLSDMGIGTWWTMKRLIFETGHSRSWIKRYILTDPSIDKFSKKVNGEWLFDADKMKSHLKQIFNE